MSLAEKEYLTQWLDAYHAGRSEDGKTKMGQIVGFLKEFKEQQDRGETDFKLPQKGKWVD